MLQKQASDSYVLGLLLALVGGFLDAYTYLCRGHVFANAQTGNIVLLGIHFIEGHHLKALSYIIPIVSFVLGIIIVEYLREQVVFQRLHWRQGIIFLEIIVIMITAFLPQSMNLLCNSMISFVCSLQVQAFRKFNGFPYASTMCTGNLRSASEALYQAIKIHDYKMLSKSLHYFGIILLFIIGAIIGTIAVYYYNMIAILWVLIALVIVFILMFTSY